MRQHLGQNRGFPIITLLFLIAFSLGSIQCTGGSVGGSGPIGGNAAAGSDSGGQTQSTPTHFGGLDNPSPDWEGCEFIGANGLPLPYEECLAKCLEELKSKKDIAVPEGTVEQKLYWCQKQLAEIENQAAAAAAPPASTNEEPPPPPAAGIPNLDHNGGRPDGELKPPGK